MSGFMNKGSSGRGCIPFLASSTSLGVDPERWEGIGTDSLGGNMVNYLVVPEEPTPDPEHRYFGHLSTVAVPDFYVGELVGLRQATIIGTRRRATPDSELVCTEQEQISPFWAFPDGNVTWYVRWTPGIPKSGDPPPSGPGGNFSNQITCATTAWLAKQVSPYVPLNGAQPPGTSVIYLDQIIGQQFPWVRSGNYLYEGYTFIGPGRFDLYVSVYQTDPSRDRGPPLVPPPVPTRIEDIFVRDNPLARYIAVAGELDVRNVPFETLRSTARDRRADPRARARASELMRKISTPREPPPRGKKTVEQQIKDLRKRLSTMLIRPSLALAEDQPLLRPSLELLAQADEFFTYGQEDIKTIPFRKAANSLVDAPGFSTPIISFPRSQYVELLTSIASQWWVLDTGKNIGDKDRSPTAYVKKANAFVWSMNAFQNTMLPSGAYSLITLDWSKVDWLNAPWTWLKQVSGWSIKDWDALRLGLLALDVLPQMYPIQPVWATQVPQGDVVVQGQSGEKWRELAWNLRWFAVPFELFQHLYYTTKTGPRSVVQNLDGSWANSVDQVLSNVKYSLRQQCPQGQIYSGFQGKCKPAPSEFPSSPPDVNLPPAMPPFEPACGPNQINDPELGCIDKGALLALNQQELQCKNSGGTFDRKTAKCTPKSSPRPCPEGQVNDRVLGCTPLDVVKQRDANARACKEKGGTYDRKTDKCVVGDTGSVHPGPPIDLDGRGNGSGDGRGNGNGDGTGNSGGGGGQNDTGNCVAPNTLDPELGCLTPQQVVELAKAEAECLSSKNGAVFDRKTRICTKPDGTQATCQPPSVLDPDRGDCVSMDELKKRAQFAMDCHAKGKFYNAHTGECTDQVPDTCPDGSPIPSDGVCPVKGSDQPTEEKKSNTGLIVGALALVGAGVGAWYFWGRGVGDGVSSTYKSNPVPGLTTLPSAPIPMLHQTSSSRFSSNPVDLGAKRVASEVQRLETLRKSREARDVIRQAIQEWRTTGRKDALEDLLLALDVHELSEETMLEVLRLTDSSLQNWERFRQDVRHELVESHGVEEADALIHAVT